MFTLEDINKYKWEEKLSQTDRHNCMSYSTIFFSQAKECDNTGDQRGCEAFRMLGGITSMYLDNENPNDPFKPQFVMNGIRTEILSDFNKEIFDIIRKIMVETKNAPIKAHFADVLWVAQKDHEAAKLAAEIYLSNFKNSDIDTDWIHYLVTLERGFIIAKMLGPEKLLFKEYLLCIEDIIRQREKTEESPLCVRLIEILTGLKTGNYVDLAIIAENIGDSIYAENSFLCRQYYEISAKCYRFAEKKEAAQRVLIKKGESFITEAEAAVKRPMQGYIVGAHFLANAIECLRQNKAPKDKIDELHKKLIEWQVLSIGEMKKIEHSVDISKVIENTSKGISGKNLIDSIFYLALGHSIIDLKQLRERTEQKIKKHPIQHIFRSTTLSKDGRVIAGKPSVLNASQDEYENALESEMFSQLSHIDWPLRSHSFIDTCREHIRNEHRPSLGELSILVQNNPFIPLGHEELYLKGIYAGFYGDFDLVAYYLIPQIEESIRHVLKINGIVTSKIDSKFIQEERSLGTLLSLPETNDIFGQDLAFELRGLLCEKHGCDLRNRLAHGFLTYRECFNFDVMLLWWHIIRLCTLPIYASLMNKSENNNQRGIKNEKE